MAVTVPGGGEVVPAGGEDVPAPWLASMEAEDEAELWSLKSERSFLSRAWMASLPTALAGTSDPSDSDWTGPGAAPGGGAAG